MLPRKSRNNLLTLVPPVDKRSKSLFPIALLSSWEPVGILPTMPARGSLRKVHNRLIHSPNQTERLILARIRNRIPKKRLQQNRNLPTKRARTPRPQTREECPCLLNRDNKINRGLWPINGDCFLAYPPSGVTDGRSPFARLTHIHWAQK